MRFLFIFVLGGQTRHSKFPAITNPRVVSGHAMRDKINIEYIIALVKEQEPERTDIVLALSNCSEGKWTTNGYYSLVIADNKPNQPGSNWQYDESIVIEQKNAGDIIIDLLKDGRIGGIEFMDLIDQ